MLTGKWKNIEELEESLCIEELQLIVESLREKEYRQMKFYAMFKGVDLDEQSNRDSSEVFEAAKRRAEAIAKGLSGQDIDKAIEADEFDELGIEIERM